MVLTGLDWKYFNWKQLEFFGDLNLLKAGLVFADTLTTVSPALRQGDPVGSVRLRIGRRVVQPPPGPAGDPERRGLYDLESRDRSTSAAAIQHPGLAVREGHLQRAVTEEAGTLAPTRKFRCWVGRVLGGNEGHRIVAGDDQRAGSHRGRRNGSSWGPGRRKYEHQLAELAREHPRRVAAVISLSEELITSAGGGGRHVPDPQPLRAVRAPPADQPEIRDGADCPPHGRAWPIRCAIRTGRPWRMSGPTDLCLIVSTRMPWSR